jgi:23S rRNA pseudouridine1911/1915/1917 synthase
MPDPQGALELLDRHAATVDHGPAGWQIHPRLTLLHLDSALAILDKGPGLLSVPAQNYEVSALTILADVLAGKHHLTRTVPQPYRHLKPLPVHRLDQFTTGVLCIAMNPEARTRLVDQLHAHTMRREYVAYVEGQPQQLQGTWRNWLKLSDDQLRQRVVPGPEADALEATTHYEVIAQFPAAGITKLRLRLETGRRHQIRVQAAHAGLPLVGDRRYNANDRGRFPRQMLHAETLTLEHPDQPGKRMTWTAPLPKDLQQFEASLK